MSWTAKILSADKRGDKWKVLIQYANGKKIFQKSYLLDPICEEQAKALLRAKIAELDSFESDSLPFPIGEVLDLAPKEIVDPEKPELTSEEVARIKWVNDYSGLDKYYRAIKAGVLSVDDADYLVLKKSVESNYLDKYWEYI
jgi:hypothetical protein